MLSSNSQQPMQTNQQQSITNNMDAAQHCEQQNQKQQQFHRRRLIINPNSSNQSPQSVNQQVIIFPNESGQTMPIYQDQSDQVTVSKFQNIIQQVNISDLAVENTNVGMLSSSAFAHGGGHHVDGPASNKVYSGEQQFKRNTTSQQDGPYNNRQAVPQLKDIQSLAQGVSGTGGSALQNQALVSQASGKGQQLQYYSQQQQPIYILRQSITSIKEMGQANQATSAQSFQDEKNQFHQNEATHVNIPASTGRFSMNTLQLAPFKQHSEPLNSQTLIKPSINNHNLVINTERASPFSNNPQSANNVFISQSTTGVIQGQYARPKTNSPFPPFASVRNSVGVSGQVSHRGNNPGALIPSMMDQRLDETQKLHMLSPNAEMIEPVLGNNHVVSQANYNYADDSTQYQSRRHNDQEQLSRGGADQQQQIFPSNFGIRSFHKRQHSRQILVQNPLSEMPGQSNGVQNFNIGGTWSSAAIMMNSSVGSTSQQICSNSPQTSSQINGQLPPQQNLFHQLNESTFSPKQANEKSSQLIKEVNYQDDQYFGEQNFSGVGGGSQSQQQHMNHQRHNLRLQKAASNSESKPKRRSPPPNDVNSAQINPQMQQSQQVFMQNNFFIQQMLSSPSNNQIRLKGGNQPDYTQGFSGGPIPFDASLSNAQGNPFFDLMEMSSVLSSTLLGGDPLVDSANSAGLPLPTMGNHQQLNTPTLHHNNSVGHPTTYYPQQAAFFQANMQQPQMINIIQNNNNLRIASKQNSFQNSSPEPPPFEEPPNASGIDTNQANQQPNKVISRKSTASRVRLNRLNKMIGATTSASQQSKQRDEGDGGTVANSEGLNQSQISNSTQGLVPQSQFQSYHSERSQPQKQVGEQQQPVWIQNKPLEDGKYSDQLGGSQKKQKLQLLNKSFRDLPNAFQNTLLSQSAIQKVNQQTPGGQAELQKQQTNLSDFSQHMSGVTPEISTLRRQIDYNSQSPLDSSVCSSSVNGKGDIPKRCNSSFIAANNDVLINQPNNQMMFESKYERNNEENRKQAYDDLAPSKMMVDQQSPQDLQSDRYSSQNSRKSTTSNTFCIEMGKAKPKILKNSFSSAYKVFMPNTDSHSASGAPGSGAGFSRRSNHRLLRGTDQFQQNQLEGANQKQVLTAQKQHPMTDQNSLDRYPQHSLTNAKTSIQRETLVTHSQRANEFSPTNPSYYITFNQDSNAEHQKFNSHNYNQRLASSNSNGGNLSSDKTSGNGNQQLQRSDSKTSSSSRHNKLRQQAERQGKNVEVPSMIQIINQKGLIGGDEAERQPPQRDFMIQSANIMGLNRKIKVNRLVNRNIINNNLSNLALQINGTQVQDNNLEENGTSFGLRKSSRVEDQLQRASAKRSRMGSFENPSLTKGSSQTNFLPNFKVSNNHSSTQVINEEEAPVIRYNQSQASHEHLSNTSRKQIFQSASRGSLATQPLIASSGSTCNLLEQNSVHGPPPSHHQRRQSQQLIVGNNQRSNPLLPPRHSKGGHHKINSFSQKRDDRIFGQPSSQFAQPQDSFNLLGASQSRLRLGYHNDNSNLSKQPSLARLDQNISADNPHFRSTQATPMNQTASFLPQERSLAANSSQVSLQRRSTKQLLAQQMLASTYQVSHIENQSTTGGSGSLQIQHSRGNMSARRRRITQQKQQDQQNKDLSECHFDQYYIQDHPNKKQTNVPPAQSTATFSQLVLEQHQQQYSTDNKINGVGMMQTPSSSNTNNNGQQQQQQQQQYDTPKIGGDRAMKHQYRTQANNSPNMSHGSAANNLAIGGKSLNFAAQNYNSRKGKQQQDEVTLM